MLLCLEMLASHTVMNISPFVCSYRFMVLSYSMFGVNCEYGTGYELEFFVCVYILFIYLIIFNFTFLCLTVNFWLFQGIPLFQYYQFF